MGRILRIEMPDDLFDRIAQSAQRSGKTPEQWLLDRAHERALSEHDRQEALASIMRFAGSIETGDAYSADNEQIDHGLDDLYRSSNGDAA